MADSTQPREHRMAPLLLLGAALAVFAPAWFGDYVYDDELLIVQNEALQRGSLFDVVSQPFYSERAGFWRPVSLLLTWIGHRASGGAAGVHAVAVLMHALAGWAAFLLARRLLGDARVALWAALLFVVHPVQVESVAWCSALSGTVAGALALLAAHAAVRWQDGHGGRWPWPVAIWLLLALLAKESAGVLLLIVPALLWLRSHASQSPASRSSLRRPSLWVALVAATVAWLSLRAVVLAGPDAATAPLARLDLAGCGDALLLVARQLRLVLVPWPLTPFHAFAPASQAMAVVALVVGIVLLAVLVRWRWRATRRAGRRAGLAASAGWLWLLVPLVPSALLHRSIGDYPLAERHAYLAVFGFTLVLVPWLWRRQRRLLPLIVLVAALVSCWQTQVWRDQRALLEHGLAHARGDALLHVMLGNLELSEAQAGAGEALPRAFASYREADRLLQDGAPPGERAKNRKAYVRAQLGLAWCELIRQQRVDRVDAIALIQIFERVLELGDPEASMWVGLGVANALAGRAQLAERAFRSAIDLDARCTEAWFNLGYLQFELGQIPAARVSLRQALRCQPDLAPAQQLLERLR